MARRSDGTRSCALITAVRDVLVESGGARDGWLVHLLVLVDVVDRTVASHSSQNRSLCRSHAVAGVLLDVVLDEWVRGPSIDGRKDRAGCCCYAALEADGSVFRMLAAMSSSLGALRLKPEGEVR